MLPRNRRQKRSLIGTQTRGNVFLTLTVVKLAIELLLLILLIFALYKLITAFTGSTVNQSTLESFDDLSLALRDALNSTEKEEITLTLYLDKDYVLLGFPHGEANIQATIGSGNLNIPAPVTCGGELCLCLARNAKDLLESSQDEIKIALDRNIIKCEKLGRGEIYATKGKASSHLPQEGFYLYNRGVWHASGSRPIPDTEVIHYKMEYLVFAPGVTQYAQGTQAPETREMFNIAVRLFRPAAEPPSSLHPYLLMGDASVLLRQAPAAP
ncbi:MAG: hypothetical protein HC945_02165 [Nitrosarchaeum sp.]|nr:hypothetical protein [Nitrosarchaeum sp.]